MATTSPFFRLPIELRYAIYDHLCLPEPRSYPYKSLSPIAAIDLTGPPLSLILANRKILQELSTYYFSRCTFRFVAQSFNNRSNKISESSLHIVRKIKKVELLLLPGTMRASGTSPAVGSITIKQMSAHWLDDQIKLLRDEAKELKTVIVSIRRVSWNHEWSVREEMEALLSPLEELRGRVEFRVGEVMGPGKVEESMKEELGLVLKWLNS
ncbi:hypothetical protein BU25DRAFT_406447 [Macroventuria anomochaeta]|uniref:Uncharacterized protein n=1 Tax=Macroventuria anomochaeta TaxID=301207 RepID=A0ACB6SD52_9PLEO|nr:uncharacterized protein BU25DRAFT_406447 [Macroventuria anomochaeta]KAF2631922.1 hypothetical protein BU25DRAFT_406447 [Macroventuria anomochaeta]